MTDPKDPETTPETTPAKGEGEGGTPAVNWEARYKGLQKTYDTLQVRFNKLQGEYDTLNAEAEGLRQQIKGHETEKATHATSLKQWETEKAELTAKLATQDFERGRTKLILAEFPDLAQFEAEGLLPSADTLDNLKPKLEAFRKAVGSMVGDGVKTKLQGASPAAGGAGGGGGQRTKETVYAELVQLAGSRKPEDRAKYAQLLAEWDEVNQPK